MALKREKGRRSKGPGIDRVVPRACPVQVKRPMSTHPLLEQNKQNSNLPSGKLALSNLPSGKWALSNSSIDKEANQCGSLISLEGR